MELLVFAKEHWMDVKTQGKTGYEHERARLVSEGRSVSDLAKFERRYAARYQPGDIVEVREDGHFAVYGWNRAAFAVVKIPGEPVDLSLMDPIDTGTKSEPFVERRRRFATVLTPSPGAEVTVALSGAIGEKTLG